MKLLLPLFILLFASLLAGCLEFPPFAKERTCDEISANGLRKMMGKSVPPLKRQAEIASLYGIESGQVSYYQDDQPINEPRDCVFPDCRPFGGFGVAKDGVRSELLTSNSNAFEVNLDFDERPPALKTVLNCFGQPDKYLAQYRYPPGPSRHMLLFELYYLHHGLVASAYEYGSGKSPPTLTNESRITRLVSIDVHSPDETLAWLTVGLDPNAIPLIKSWPGKVEDVVVDIEPNLQ